MLKFLISLNLILEIKLIIFIRSSNALENSCLRIETSNRNMAQTSEFKGFNVLEYLSKTKIIHGFICTPNSLILTNTSCMVLKIKDQNASNFLIADVMKGYYIVWGNSWYFRSKMTTIINPCFEGSLTDCYNGSTNSTVLLTDRVNMNNFIIKPSLFNGKYKSGYFDSRDLNICILHRHLSNFLPCVDKLKKSNITTEPNCIPTQGLSTNVKNFKSKLNIYIFICTGLALLCATLQILISIIVKNYKVYPQNMYFSLTIAFGCQLLFFIIKKTISTTLPLCILIYCFQRYTLLVMGLFALFIGFDLWNRFRFLENQRNKLPYQVNKLFILYSLTSWLLPLVFIIIDCTLGIITDKQNPLHFKTNFMFCNIEKWLPTTIFYRIPLCCIAIFNTFVTIYIMITVKNSMHTVNRKSRKVLEIHSVLWRLAIVMGVGWCIGVISDIVDVEVLYYIDFTALAIQGFSFLYIFALKNIIYESEFCKNHCLHIKKPEYTMSEQEVTKSSIK